MKTISILAFLIFLVPFVGFPSNFEDIFLIITSVLIIVKSFIIHLKLKRIIPLLKKEQGIDDLKGEDYETKNVFEDSTEDYKIEDLKKEGGY